MAQIPQVPQLNLGQGANLLQFHQSVATSRTRLAANFQHPNPLPANHQALAYMCQFTTILVVSQLVVGNYVILEASPNGPPPTIANILMVGNFQFATFKVIAVSPAAITLRRVGLINDDHSAGVVAQNALASYGPIQTDLFFNIPPPPADGEPAPPINWLVAIQALHNDLQNLEQPIPIPGAPILGAPAVPAPLNQQDQFLQQLVQGQANLAAASKETPLRSMQFLRLKSLAHVFSPAVPLPGKFATVLDLLQIGRPAGQPPSAAYLSFTPMMPTIRRTFFDYAAHLTARTVNISDTKLGNAILLWFDPSKETSIMDFATPNDIPLTFTNIIPFVTRVCDIFAIVFGEALPMAIISFITTLVDMHDKLDVPDLVPSDCITLIEQKLYLIDEFPPFNAAVQFQGDLSVHLTTYFAINNHDREMTRMINARKQEAQQQILPTDGTKRGVKRQNTPTNLTVPNTRSRSTAAGKTGVAPAASPAAPTVTTKQLTDWYKELFTKVPSLENEELPCLHWLANKPPCLQHPACKKSKKKHQGPHTLEPHIVPHVAVLKTWLQTDPLGRF